MSSVVLSRLSFTVKVAVPGANLVADKKELTINLDEKAEGVIQIIQGNGNYKVTSSNEDVVTATIMFWKLFPSISTKVENDSFSELFTRFIEAGSHRVDVEAIPSEEDQFPAELLMSAYVKDNSGGLCSR